MARLCGGWSDEIAADDQKRSWLQGASETMPFRKGASVNPRKSWEAQELDFLRSAYPNTSTKTSIEYALPYSFLCVSCAFHQRSRVSGA
jgi:hypothetical protein